MKQQHNLSLYSLKHSNEFYNLVVLLYRFAGVRTHRNSLRTTVIDDNNEFPLTAQAIKLPTQSVQTTTISKPLQFANKPKPQGMPKSSSIGGHVRIHVYLVLLTAKSS